MPIKLTAISGGSAQSVLLNHCASYCMVSTAAAVVSGIVAGVAAAASTAFDFSSTPSPRQRGHELRPVVNHYSAISNVAV